MLSPDSYLVYALGFLAQLLFSARMLVQWILSERAKKVVSPQLYWQLSIVAAIIMFFYGWLRHDFAIILGQSITYFIYIYNLKLLKAWKKMPAAFRMFCYLVPLIVIPYAFINYQSTVQRLFHNSEIPMYLLLWGSAGQVVFTLRFVYQWFSSRKIQKSILPMGFWVISLTGSAMIVSYAVYRRDPVLFLGQIFGAAIYARNIWLMIHSRKISRTAE
jgi:lipid-A-disaccharide synthase-like uncharacterized protein